MTRPQVVIVGGGVAGYQAARALARRVRGGADIVLISPAGVTVRQELLPQVLTGVLGPQEVGVPLLLPGVRVVVGTVTHIDAQAQRVLYDGGVLSYDRLIVAAGSVSEVAKVSAISAHSVGFHWMSGRSAGSWRNRPSGCCPTCGTGCPGRRPGCCGRAAWRCGRRPRSAR